MGRGSLAWACIKPPAGFGAGHGTEIADHLSHEQPH